MQPLAWLRTPATTAARSCSASVRPSALHLGDVLSTEDGDGCGSPPCFSVQPALRFRPASADECCLSAETASSLGKFKAHAVASRTPPLPCGPFWNGVVQN